jgi:hypothetical protein
LLFQTAFAASPSLAETFSTDPALGGRFDQLIFGTESSFTYNAADGNLTALLDVDRSPAYYLSAPFTPLTGDSDASFSVNFRVLNIDDRVLPTAFIGLVSTQHVALGGDGLTMVLATTNGLPVVSAAVDQGPFQSGGASIQLSALTDYLAVGRYTASNRQFTVEVFGGQDYVNLLGTSTAWATNSTRTNVFQVDRVGLQNGGGQLFDQTNGSITVLVDNLFVPGRPPVRLSISDIALNEPAGGRTNALFTVLLSTPLLQTVRVEYATLDLTALAGQDYLATNGTLEFPPGTTSQTISVPVLGDAAAEPDETFLVVLTNAVNASLAVAIARCTIYDDDTCLVSISDAGVVEPLAGTINALFAVTLSTSNEQPVWVSYATSNHTATAGSDYLATSGLLLFAPGVTRQTVTVTVLGDILDEYDETFLVALGQPTNATLARAFGVGTITNNPATPVPTVSVFDAPAVAEGDTGQTNAVFSIRLSAPSGKPVLVTCATADGAATAGCDFKGTKMLLQFPPGQTNALLPIPVAGDTVYESDETFFLNLRNPTNATLLRTQAVATILNDDPIPRILIQDTGVAEGDSGVTNAVFRLSLSNPSSQPVSVRLFTTNGTALAGRDYLSTNGLVTFQAVSCGRVTDPAATNQTFSVPVIGNTQNELDKTFGVVLHDPSSGLLGRGEAIGTILNDDWVSISISDASVVEGNSGTTDAVFQVTLSSPSLQPVAVNFATQNGTARAGSDFVAVSGLLTFAPGVTAQTIHVPVIGDLVDEPDETFLVILSGQANARLARSFATGTIVNDDPPAISALDTSVLEGNSGLTMAQFTLKLSSARTNVIRVDFATSDGTAVAGSDYLATNGTVTFPPGVDSVTVPVAVIGDTNYEADETFFLNLTNATAATLARARAVCTIINDDQPPLVHFPADFAILEGTCTNLQISLSYTSALPVVISYCVSGSPPGFGTSCGSNCCTLVIPPGMSGTNFQVCVTNNLVDEPDYPFALDFVIRTGGLPGTNPHVRGLRVDDDPPEARGWPARVVEGDAGFTNLVFLVTLSSAASGPVLLDFRTVDGTATNGLDYLGTNGTLTMLPGQTNATISVPVIGDTLTELDETLFLCLTNPRNATLTNATVVGTIVDDDAPCVFMSSDVRVVEPLAGTTNAVFNVWLTHPSTLYVLVGYVILDGTATAGADFVPQSGTLVFAPGTTNTNIVVVVNSDLEVEPDETFTVLLGDNANAGLCVETGVGTIIDQTARPVIVVQDASVAEGNSGVTSAVFRASLSRASPQTITVGFATADGTALAGQDYLATSGQFTFLPGIISTSFVVGVYGDLSYEGDEFFLVNLTNSPLATLASSQVRGVIHDDDPPPTLCLQDVAVREGDFGSTNVVFQLRLSAASSFTTAVQYATSDGTAKAGKDYVATNGSAVFVPGQTNADVSVAVLGNLQIEPNRTFFLNLFGPQSAILCTNQASATIVDDDDIRISIDSISALEGTIAHFKLTLSQPPGSEVTVEYATADDTAFGSLDYLPTNGVVRFPAFATNQTVDVVVLADDLDEPAETFFLELSRPTHASLLLTQAVCTILDTNPPCLSISDNSVLDDGSGRIPVVSTVCLSSTSSLPISVSFETLSGTAIEGGDYVPNSGTIVFPPGATCLTITNWVYGNTLDETNEFFFVTLSKPSNATCCKCVGTITLPMVPNEPPLVRLVAPEPGLCLTVPTNLLLTADAFDADGRIISVAFYANTNKIGEIFSAPGNTNRLFSMNWFPIPPGSYAVTAVALDNYLDLSTSAPVYLVARRAAALSVDDVSLFEGDTLTNAVFTVSLTAPSCLPVAVQVATADGTALAGSDYVAVSTNLIFTPGVTQALVSVPILGDAQIEPDKTFQLCLANPVNATLLRACGLGTILNDDSNVPPAVTILSPAGGETFYWPPGLVPILAEGTHSNGYVRSVDFFAGSNYLGTVTNTSPANSRFDFTWTGAQPGLPVLTAIATDEVGGKATSAPVRITIAACSGDLTASLPPSLTACACGVVVISNTVHSSEPVAFLWRFNGSLLPGETNGWIELRNPKEAQSGVYTAELRTPCKAVTNFTHLTIEGEHMPNPIMAANPSSILINDLNVATPYPSPINLNCIPGPIDRIVVTVSNISHTFPGDIDMLLAGPTGRAIVLMSDAGNNYMDSTNTFTLTFSDDAATMLPESPSYNQNLSGTYLPTDYVGLGDGSDYFPALDKVTYVQDLSAFRGSDPNGSWGLYIVDDHTLDWGAVEGGWSLTIHWQNPQARLSLPAVLGDSRVGLNLTGLPGLTYVIEASANLQQWAPLSTNVLDNASMPLVVPVLTDSPGCFYRAVCWPCAGF